MIHFPLAGTCGPCWQGGPALILGNCQVGPFCGCPFLLFGLYINPLKPPLSPLSRPLSPLSPPLSPPLKPPLKQYLLRGWVVIPSPQILNTPHPLIIKPLLCYTLVLYWGDLVFGGLGEFSIRGKGLPSGLCPWILWRAFRRHPRHGEGLLPRGRVQAPIKTRRLLGSL